LLAPARTVGHRRQFAGEDDQGEVLPAGNAGRVRLFALKHAQLLAEEQDFNVLVLLSSTRYPDEVEQHREGLREKQADHDGRSCRDHAKQRYQKRNRTMEKSLKGAAVASVVFSAPYGPLALGCRLSHLPETLNFLIIVKLRDRIDLPAREIHIWLEKSRHFVRCVGLNKQESSATASQVVPSADPFWMIHSSIMLLHDPLGHLLTGHACVPFEPAVPKHRYTSIV
jgi:hypothetical protein